MHRNPIAKNSSLRTPVSGLAMAAAQARLNKHVTPHTLRHSYATGLLEAGVDLMAISRLLGHSSFATTMVYLHCRRQHLGTAPSPIDWLPVRQCPKWVDPTSGPNSSLILGNRRELYNLLFRTAWGIIRMSMLWSQGRPRHWTVRLGFRAE